MQGALLEIPVVLHALRVVHLLMPRFHLECREAHFQKARLAPSFDCRIYLACTWHQVARQLTARYSRRHGKFRPTLMSLVSSNTPEVARKTVQEAIALYKKEEDVDKAVGVLTNLRGVGPATASLLLTVHDPTRVIFFSDEAFHWLCCEGKKAPIKYNAKEYRQLRLRADELANRLGVSATDIEKVSYVLMKQSAAGLPVVSKDRQDIPIGSVSVSEKRKTASDPDLAPTELSLRRSKRTKA